MHAKDPIQHEVCVLRGHYGIGDGLMSSTLVIISNQSRKAKILNFGCQKRQLPNIQSGGKQIIMELLPLSVGSLLVEKRLSLAPWDAFRGTSEAEKLALMIKWIDRVGSRIP